MDAKLRKAKLDKLLEIQGYSDITKLAEAVFHDAQKVICDQDDFCRFVGIVQGHIAELNAVADLAAFAFCLTLKWEGGVYRSYLFCGNTLEDWDNKFVIRLLRNPTTDALGLCPL